MITSLRVLVADDHKLVLASLCALLNNCDGFHVVAAAIDGRQAVALAKQHLPQVAILDVFMPELNGIAATERIKLELPQVQVLVRSSVVSETLLLDAFRAGAIGFIISNVHPSDLLYAVRLVAQGEFYLGPDASRCLVRRCLTANSPLAEVGPLTLRQREVLQLVAEGHTTKSIAKTLGISVKTAEMHRTQMMGALDIHNTAGLVRYAITQEIIAAEMSREKLE